MVRDRYNEAIRIMSTLGASAITCETYGGGTVRRGLRARVLGRGGEMTHQRIENSGFDVRHDGAGSAARDPRPLRRPDEPGFAAAVSSVLENGATEVVINIRSNRTHAVDGALGLELKRVGLDLGGVAQRTGPPACTSGRTSHWHARVGGSGTSPGRRAGEHGTAEDQVTAQALADSGHDVVQGTHLARPMDGTAVLGWLRARTPGLAWGMRSPWPADAPPPDGRGLSALRGQGRTRRPSAQRAAGA